MDRWEVERALRGSALPPQGRLIALALLTRADAETAAIPVAFTPSLAAIARDTGLSTASVKRYLNVLEAGGWITRGRSKRAAAEHMPTTYRLHAPAGRTGPLVADSDQSHSATRHTESLGAQGAKPPRRTESQGLGSGSRGAGLTVSQNQTSTRPKPDQKKSAAADPYAGLPGFAEFWDAYPRKTAKRTAASAYRSALSRCGDASLIIKGAARYRDDPGRGPAYTKHPTTWLNGDCWLDEPSPNGRPRSRQAETDELFARAMERARARDAAGQARGPVIGGELE